MVRRMVVLNNYYIWAVWAAWAVWAIRAIRTVVDGAVTLLINLWRRRA